MLDLADLEFIAAAAGNRAPATQVLTLAAAERRHIEKILALTNWNITHSARMLAISPTTLRKKIADFRLGKATGATPAA